MAEINNSDVKKELISGAKIQIAVDKVPSQLAEKVVPTMEVNPKLLRICNIVKSTTSAVATLYTVPTTKDFYLTNAWICVQGNATDSPDRNLTVTIDGLAVVLLITPGITLSEAVCSNLNLNLRFPIKIDRGSDIDVGGQELGAVGIVGYTVED